MFTILCMLLVIVGAVNWFSVGVFNFNIINWIFTARYYVGARVIYGLVGVAGLWLVGYLIYNKFNSRRIHTIENGIKENMQEKTHKTSTTVVEAGSIEVPSIEEQALNTENAENDNFENYD